VKLVCKISVAGHQRRALRFARQPTPPFHIRLAEVSREFGVGILNFMRWGTNAYRQLIASRIESERGS
jgi:hypothetical protein